MTRTYKTLYGAPMDTQPSSWVARWERNFIQEMQRLRESRNMTQTDLARELRPFGLKFHQQTIQRIETGERPVRLNEAHLIAYTLGVDLESMTAAISPDDRDLLQSVSRVRRGAGETALAIQEALWEWADDLETLGLALSERIERGPQFPDETTKWGLAWVLKILWACDSLEDAWDQMSELDTARTTYSEKELVHVLPKPDVLESMRIWVTEFDDAELDNLATGRTSRDLYRQFPGEVPDPQQQAPTTSDIDGRERADTESDIASRWPKLTARTIFRQLLDGLDLRISLLLNALQEGHEIPDAPELKDIREGLERLLDDLFQTLRIMEEKREVFALDAPNKVRVSTVDELLDTIKSQRERLVRLRRERAARGQSQGPVARRGAEPGKPQVEE